MFTLNQILLALNNFSKLDNTAISKQLFAEITNFSSKQSFRFFLANFLYETLYLKALVENMNYSTPERILNIFSAHIKTLDEAKQYINQPEKLGNKVYGGRMGNSYNEGYKYRGRGGFHLTGKENYTLFSKFCGVDCVANPDLVAKDYVVKSAIWYWNSRKAGDLTDFKKVVFAINGGYNGLEDRHIVLSKLLALLP